MREGLERAETPPGLPRALRARLAAVLFSAAE
jgi:hypothetical protein